VLTKFSLFPLLVRLLRLVSLYLLGFGWQRTLLWFSLGLGSFANRSVLFLSQQSNWDEVTDNFDNMGLKEDLLRGIYAYGLVFTGIR
jgi:hypothetical protein